MRKISNETLEKLKADPFYEVCCISGKTPVQWHHNLIIAGRQVDEWWAILPLHKDIHDRANEREMRDKLDWIMLNRAPTYALKRLSIVIDLVSRRKMLNKKYEKIN